jgi:succinyl-diaminopimelate desuccinylase
MPSDNLLYRFADKYLLALEKASESQPENGASGFELEWNLLDEELRPLLTVGSGPSQQSFVDYLRAECLSPWVRVHSQLEVFHWMIEWVTRPYYSPRGAVYESRLMEAALINALSRAGRTFGVRLYSWPGVLPRPVPVGPDSIPRSWHLAKRLYLERCVNLFGERLATAGLHANLSLPEPLFAWDFMHLSAAERGDRHLDEFKSEFYIQAARRMRAFAALFIATSAATPFRSVRLNGETKVFLAEEDSVRNLTFPNPSELDLPDLYRSYEDYLQISYRLVRSGVRFGNNNWTPVRARSFAEPVERLIEITSEQLEELYARGLYSAGKPADRTEMARQIEMQNLMARINLPMARVEVRTDDGGHLLEVDTANLTLKQLLLACIYADPEFASAFRYDAEDIACVRRNEELAARHGLRAMIENPFNGKPVGMRTFLEWTLQGVRPLAEALGVWEDLQPLVEMAAGMPSTAERLRERLRLEAGKEGELPLDLLKALAEEREAQVAKDIERIASDRSLAGVDGRKISEFLQRAREDERRDPLAPIRFRHHPAVMLDVSYPDKTSEIVDLARQLIQIPSVTAAPQERLDEVSRAAAFIAGYLRDHGLEVIFHEQETYPAIAAGFPEGLFAPVMLGGHFDVVPPEPDDSQFNPVVDGDYLVGRGAADMKTVVATYLVWMKDQLRQGPAYPPVSLLLVGNEENGEADPMGTPHMLKLLEEEGVTRNGQPYTPGLFIAGERTGEKGDELWGEICVENRGVMRFDLLVHGQRRHTGTAGAQGDLSEKLLAARQAVREIAEKYLTLNASGGWRSQLLFPFIQIGTPGIYNIQADRGILGVEIRPVPQDDLQQFEEALADYCRVHEIELVMKVKESGIRVDPDNPFLQALIRSVQKVSGREPVLGRKLAGTSARFAPRGQGVVWGQSGLGPHARDERHYIPSIEPYYMALVEFGRSLIHLMQEEHAYARRTE